ncbi:hypothetical protein DICPUDRAFT_151903 [Dictyostelium purpureum]|uniref:non-specific serine/threonine protein kinase n=1 Tax=Dictyostelium purpureum TaxID=5786 RepID=F0ZK18_DICPU|nr:uncharacterized protein DICPUDRAFT_151903 [Dictyostelium purpureum]EGC35711.1 hypothetical protein DICPUDRAFT_151903 [Dictyostelium purpureum]|eukprot:XP_003287767.1 hypothetical protein DICPUDRAFT_151903 [Dictyostelium purpureum]
MGEKIEILKSPNDKNQYRYIKLENDLEIVVVSDPSSDYSACSLSVGVGSLSDPREVPGLAHFLEHMLFLGTEKFPVEKEFSSLISLNSGSYNASTALNKTTYYYKLPNKDDELLRESLDRFSSFFISPLMNKDAVSRELNAVDSEHNNNREKDAWRLNRIVNDQFEDHPISNFQTGNKETLDIEGIREKVVDFYNKFYSANNMKVSLYGKESLNQLEALAREFFSPIKNKNLEVPKFEPLQLKQSVWIEAQSNQYDLLKLISPIYDTSISFQTYKDQSPTIFSHIIGHEATGSLYSVLVEKDYATSLSFGLSSSAPTINKSELNVFLTPLGKENIDEIIGLYFQYIEKFTVPEYTYEEKKLLSEVNWSRFQKSDPMAFVTNISHHLLKVDSPADVIKYNHFWENFSPEKIEKIKTYIRPDNMVAILYVQDPKVTNQVEKYYGLEFSKRIITEDEIKRWKAVPNCDKLYTPGPNPFMPDDFTMKAPQDQKICIPEVVYDENGVLIFHSMDRRFNTPRTKVNIKFETPFYGTTYGNVFALLLKKSLKGVLNEKILYYLSVLDYEMSMDVLYSRFELWANGFSSKIFIALEEVLKFFYSFELTDQQFESIKYKTQKKIESSLVSPPYVTADNNYLLYTLSGNGSIKDKIQILQSVTKESFLSSVKNFFNYINFTILVVGNSSKEEVQTFGQNLNKLNRIKVAANDVFTLARVNLPQGIETHVKKQADNPEQKNCAVTMAFLIGEAATYRNKAIGLLLSQIISIAYFDELRTKQQVGYIVRAEYDQSGHTTCVRTVAQSHTKTPEEIYAATEKFLIDYVNDLLELEKQPELFKNIINSLKQSTIASCYNNRQQANFYWTCYLYSYDFEFDVRICNELEKLTIQDIIQAFNDYFLPSSSKRRLFVSQVYPASMKFDVNSKPEKENINVIPDGTHSEFRQNCIIMDIELIPPPPREKEHLLIELDVNNNNINNSNNSITTNNNIEQQIESEPNNSNNNNNIEENNNNANNTVLNNSIDKSPDTSNIQGATANQGNTTVAETNTSTTETTTTKSSGEKLNCKMHRSNFILTQIGGKKLTDMTLEELLDETDERSGMGYRAPGPQGFLQYVGDVEMKPPTSAGSQSPTLKSSTSSLQNQKSTGSISKKNQQSSSSPVLTSTPKLKSSSSSVKASNRDSAISGTSETGSTRATKERKSLKPTSTLGRLQKNEEERRKRKEQKRARAREKPIYVGLLDELPAECLKMVKKSKIPEEKLNQNLHILLPILRFRTGYNLRSVQTTTTTTTTNNNSSPALSSSNSSIKNNSHHHHSTSNGNLVGGTQSPEISNSTELNSNNPQLQTSVQNTSTNNVILTTTASQSSHAPYHPSHKSNEEDDYDDGSRLENAILPKGTTDLIDTERDVKKLYKNLKQIGSGGFGSVFLAKSTVDKCEIAIKKIAHVSAKAQRTNLNEIGFLNFCKHPNIVSYLRSHLVDDQIWIAMEYMQGGTLTEAAHGHSFNESCIAYVARGMLEGLQYLHQHNTVHRDIKSGNIMMTIEGKIKIVDFGLCVDANERKLVHMAGSPFWMSPEMIRGEGYSCPTDIWSFAICLLELANGEPPHRKSSLTAMFTTATEGCAGLDRPERWTPSFTDFLNMCLQMDPTKRATATELLKHPWLQLSENPETMKKILAQIFIANVMNHLDPI